LFGQILFEHVSYLPGARRVQIAPNHAAREMTRSVQILFPDKGPISEATDAAACLEKSPQLWEKS
jgi:hypothetical protein